MSTLHSSLHARAFGLFPPGGGDREPPEWWWGNHLYELRWQACAVPPAECLEVTGSHVGLVVNRGAYRAIGHALAKPALEPR